MARHATAVDVADAPELARLADAVRRSGRPVALKRGAETLAVVRPAPARKPAGAEPRHRRRTGILRPDDALFQLAGIGASGGPGDISSNTHHYLAEAYSAEAR